MTYKICTDSQVPQTICDDIESLRRFDGANLTIGPLEFGRQNNISLLDEARAYYLALRKLDELSNNPNNIFRFDDDVLPLSQETKSTGQPQGLPLQKTRPATWDDLFTRIGAINNALRTQILPKLPPWAQEIVTEIDHAGDMFAAVEKYHRQLTPSMPAPEMDIVDMNYGMNPFKNFFENTMPTSDSAGPTSEAWAIIKFLKNMKENPQAAITNPKSIGGFSNLPKFFRDIILMPSKNLDALYAQLEEPLPTTEEILKDNKKIIVILLCFLCICISSMVFKNHFTQWNAFRRKSEHIKTLAGIHEIDLDEAIAKRKRINE